MGKTKQKPAQPTCETEQTANKNTVPCQASVGSVQSTKDNKMHLRYITRYFSGNKATEGLRAQAKQLAEIYCGTEKEDAEAFDATAVLFCMKLGQYKDLVNNLTETCIERVAKIGEAKFKSGTKLVDYVFSVPKEKGKRILDSVFQNEYNNNNQLERLKASIHDRRASASK